MTQALSQTVRSLDGNGFAQALHAGTLAVLVGATGRLELAVAGGSAAAATKAQAGAPVRVTW